MNRPTQVIGGPMDGGWVDIRSDGVQIGGDVVYIFQTEYAVHLYRMVDEKLVHDCVGDLQEERQG